MRSLLMSLKHIMKKKKTQKGKTWRHHRDKWHWRLTWLVKEKEQGTRQCNLRNMPRMTVLDFPLLFLFLPFWRRGGFSTQQCNLQWFQTQRYIEKSHENMQKHMGVEKHSVESSILNNCHLKSDRKKNKMLSMWGERP